MKPALTSASLACLAVLSTAIRVDAFSGFDLPNTSGMQTSLHSAASESIMTKFDQDEGGNKGIDLNRDIDTFLQHTRILSKQRNLHLEHVLNARDLATAHTSLIIPGKIYRTGKLSDASEKDIQVLMNDVGLKTLIDLRSETELSEDSNLEAAVYGNFRNVVWKDRGRKNEGCVRVLKTNESPVKERFWKRSQKRQEILENMLIGKDATEPGECEECGTIGGVATSEYKVQQQKIKERLFVPLMNEFKYAKGTVTKLRKRDLLKALIRAPGSLFSRRVRKAIKKPFVNKINGGGLPMLNELLLRYGAPGIRYVLELCADENRHPVAFYCTAGKDRTGAIAAIMLALCGMELESIVEDYSLSANVYADLEDSNAMVGALQQRDLNPDVFLGASPHVMRETLHDIEEQYGSVFAYATWIGFGPEKQQKLRETLLK